MALLTLTRKHLRPVVVWRGPGLGRRLVIKNLQMLLAPDALSCARPQGGLRQGNAELLLKRSWRKRWMMEHRDRLGHSNEWPLCALAWRQAGSEVLPSFGEGFGGHRRGMSPAFAGSSHHIWAFALLIFSFIIVFPCYLLFLKSRSRF